MVQLPRICHTVRENQDIVGFSMAPGLGEKGIVAAPNMVLTKASNLPASLTRATVHVESRGQQGASTSPPGTPGSSPKSRRATKETCQVHPDADVKPDCQPSAFELSPSISCNLPVTNEPSHRSSTLPSFVGGTPRWASREKQHRRKSQELRQVHRQASGGQSELSGQHKLDVGFEIAGQDQCPSHSMELPAYKSTPPSTPVKTTQADASFAEPSETIIFLDWDDTVFPTTQMFEIWGLTFDEPADTPYSSLLKKWAESFTQLMLTVCRLTAKCVIVTNSSGTWVEKCIERFAPGLKECLAAEGLTFHVVYARDHLPKRCARPCKSTISQSKILKEEMDDMMTMGKFAAMRSEVCRFYSRYKKQTWKNIISIGDAPYERYALQEVAFKRNTTLDETLRTKTITLKATLTLKGMLNTFEALQSLLPKWVSHDGDLDIDVTSKMLAIQLPSYHPCESND